MSESPLMSGFHSLSHPSPPEKCMDEVSGRLMVHLVRRQVHLRITRRLDRRPGLAEGRRPLVGLSADQAVELMGARYCTLTGM